MNDIHSAGYKLSSLHSVVDELWASVNQAPDLFPRGSLLRFEK